MEYEIGKYETVRLNMPFIRKRVLTVITQTELAERMGVTQPNISKMFKRGRVKRCTLRKLANELGIDEHLLVHRNDIIKDE